MISVRMEVGVIKLGVLRIVGASWALLDVSLGCVLNFVN